MFTKFNLIVSETETLLINGSKTKLQVTAAGHLLAKMVKVILLA